MDRTLLQGLHHDVHNAIREADDKTLVIYEETQFPDSFPIFGGLVHEVGFTENPAGPHSPYSNRTVLSMHNYCCIASPSACDRDGNPVASDAHLCDKYAQRKVRHTVSCMHGFAYKGLDDLCRFQRGRRIAAGYPAV